MQHAMWFIVTTHINLYVALHAKGKLSYELILRGVVAMVMMWSNQYISPLKLWGGIYKIEPSFCAAQ